MKHIFISLLVVIFTFTLKAQQDTPFDKKLFKEQKDAFKEAEDYLKQGNELFNVISPEYLDENSSDYKIRATYYREALPLLVKANNFNPNNSQLNYKIGRCYLVSPVYKEESVPHLEKALKLNPNVAPDIHYHLGRAYHITMNFDKAIAAFEKHKAVASKNPAELEDLIRRIDQCKTAKELVANPVRVFIDNLGGIVNSKYPEYGAIISADESVMMFTSRRNSTTGGMIDPGLNEYYEDIYITKKTNGRWSAPENIGSPVNTEEHDATVAVAPDAQSMIIYIDDKGDGNLYETKLVGTSWSKPKKMNKNINTKYHESSASYSSDGKTLYFVSNKPDGGLGNRDIYVTQWDENLQDWGPATNLGASINTKYNEESVLIHPDGKTLYFSSQGHKSMGGYDIFVSEKQDNGTWSEPKNLGYPINTVDDDVFFIINSSGRRGYYSSFKSDGYGEKDIYMITFLGPEKPMQTSSEDNLLASIAKPVSEKVIEKVVNTDAKKITILKGIISDEKTKQPLGASIELVDVEANLTLATFESNNSTGKYLVSLPSGKNYGLIIRKEGYLFHSENFNIPESAAYQEVERNIELKKIDIGSIIVLKNIFYDYNKATLRDASKNELDRLVKLLNENPTIKIELSAHTDSRGSDKYNEDLSQKRAQSCVDYLVKNGIAADRLVSKGYGESIPVVTDAEIAKLKFEEDKEAAHQENRRTEFKILSK